jgi:hypothetical protein
MIAASQSHREAAIFPSLALGVAIGRTKIGGFSAGDTAATPIMATMRATAAGPPGLSCQPLLLPLRSFQP